MDASACRFREYNLLLLLIGVLIFSVAAACSTSEGTRKGPAPKTHDESGVRVTNLEHFVDLTTHLRSVPGVIVRGDGSDAVITVSGAEASAFGTETTPLFILDGSTLNISYNQIYNLVNGMEIKSIRVLKGTDAAFYGMRGKNGAIEIITK